MAISDAELRSKWNGDRWLSDGGSRGAGRLVAKIAETSVIFYFAHFDGAGARRFLPIGDYDAAGRRGITLRTARDIAAERSRLYRDGTRDLHAHFNAVNAAVARARQSAEDAARRAEEASKRSTLRQLLDAYTTHLEDTGKQATRDARTLFRLHVFEAAPEIADRRAAEIQTADFVRLIAALTAARKGRTAAKLRSYLRAAYSLAIKSKTDPAAPLIMQSFGIEANPIASIGALSQFSQPRTRTLKAEELGKFLKRLNAAPDGVRKDAVALCLMLGGQRPTQLLRVHTVDVDLSAGTITMRDSKGARSVPRIHTVPVTKQAAEILGRLLKAAAKTKTGLVFSSDGKKPLRIETVSEFVADISAAMVKAQEVSEPFQLRDLRRTCETTLASLKVSSDVRAVLLSHGLGGIQKRHYDFHDYADEMRTALEKWQRHLKRLVTDEPEGATVTPIRAAKK